MNIYNKKAYLIGLVCLLGMLLSFVFMFLNNVRYGKNCNDCDGPIYWGLKEDISTSELLQIAKNPITHEGSNLFGEHNIGKYQGYPIFTTYFTTLSQPRYIGRLISFGFPRLLSSKEVLEEDKQACFKEGGIEEIISFSSDITNQKFALCTPSLLIKNHLYSRGDIVFGKGWSGRMIYLEYKNDWFSRVEVWLAKR